MQKLPERVRKFGSFDTLSHSSIAAHHVLPVTVPCLALLITHEGI